MPGLKVSVADRSNFVLDYEVDDEIVRELRDHGHLDRYVTITLLEGRATNRIVPGAVCVDVGANIGYYSLLLSDLVGAQGRVHAFEGAPRTAAVLRRNVAANDRENIVVNAVPVLGHSQAVAEVARAGSSQSAFVATPAADAGLRSVTIDEYCTDFDRVDFIKVDVNGPDYEVLSGALETLERYRPQLLVEFIPRAIEPATYRVVTDRLHQLGYVPFFWRGHTNSGLEVCDYRILDGFFELWRELNNPAWMNLLYRHYPTGGVRR